MWMSVGKRCFTMTLTKGPASCAFASQPFLMLGMANFNGQKQHAELPQALPVSARRAETVRDSDLMPCGAITLAWRRCLASVQQAPNFPKKLFFN